ncbi:uncharacterized protein KY384_005592 [Bacidia gigantensis]|uniref:uncharacterized protein n=1 Tax=Bacidia gigantensis TaxID=2732470 RepID=UPI001D0486EF|nr:uncharacterized protein KY384_005592 [Bacidia gigantensis]KAG8530110.1 hypothetical protein KY384_005592 [Bacidia gigantensis]
MASGPTKLLPVNINQFERMTGLRRRDDSEQFTDLDFQTQSQLVYGSPGEHGQVLFANMTLFAPDGLQIVMMERFEGLTSAVDCQGNDGTLSLTFKSQDAFNYALKTWSTINDHEDHRFLMIANHAGCGPDDERQPYIISKITEKTDSWTTFLAAQPAPWEDVAGTYDLDFGKVYPTKNSKLKHRGIGDWLDDVKDTIGDVAEDVKDGVEKVGDGIADTVQGNADFSKSVSFPVNMLSPNEKHNIWEDPEGRFSLDCVNCYVQGSFQVTGHLSVKGWHLEDLSLDASPQNFNAQLGLEASVTATTKKLSQTLGYQKEIFSAAIPDAGIKVPGLFTLGAKISYNVGFNASIAGTAKFDFGLKSTLPNTAKAVLNIAGDGDSSATGFDGAVDPYFDINEISASLKIAVFSKPKISFGIDLTKVGKAEVGVAMKLPELSATVTTKYKPGGACPDDKKKTETGVDLALQAVISVDAEVDAAWGEDADTKLPKWSKSLWNKPFDVPWHPCFPFNIPELKPGGGDTSSATPKPSPAPTPQKKAAAGDGDGDGDNSTPDPQPGAAPEPEKTKPKTSSSSAAAPAKSSMPPATGGGGCKFKRENGRRMLVC